MNLLVNGKLRDVPAPMTVHRLLEWLELPTRGIAVEVNEQIVPRPRHVEHELSEGDRLEIMSLVGGG